MRTIDDILEYTERKNISGLLVAIDFQKAFDSIKRSYMVKALSAFNFGPSLIHRIQTFYKNITSTVMNNGYTTTPFQILQGVRQGDPLFFIFIHNMFGNFCFAVAKKFRELWYIMKK